MPRRERISFDNPYAAPGRWWKVAIHAHTKNSDGRWPPARVVAAYRRLRCDALAITDHEFVTRVPAHRGRPLLIPAAEITGPPDILYLGAKESGRLNMAGAGLQGTIDRIRQRGGIAIIAHPSWSGLDDRALLAARGHVAIELYNQVAQDLNGRGWGLEAWDHLLQAGKRVWATSDDDAHFGEWRGKPGSAWLRVKAPVLSVPSVLEAIRRGRFHSTSGPAILDIRTTGGRVVLHTSPVCRVHLISAGIGAGGLQIAPTGRTQTRWTFDIIKERLNVTTYARFEAIDRSGRTAWSNPLFVRGKGIRFW